MSISNKIAGLREIWHFDNRWELIYERLFNAGGPVSVYRIGGMRVLVDHAAGDANGAREVLTSDMYRRFFPLIDTTTPINVLDIGANNGGFPLLLRLEKIRIQRLVSVEFNPKTFARLHTNIDTNLDDIDFELVNAAVCGENRAISVPETETGTSDSIYTDQESANGLTVEGITFDELYQRTFSGRVIDVCKMDIEGAEFEIFSNPGHESIKQCRNLIIEIHHSETRHRDLVIKKLTKLGFKELNGDNNREDNLHYVHFFRNTKPL